MPTADPQTQSFICTRDKKRVLRVARMRALIISFAIGGSFGAGAYFLSTFERGAAAEAYRALALYSLLVLTSYFYFRLAWPFHFYRRRILEIDIPPSGKLPEGWQYSDNHGPTRRLLAKHVREFLFRVADVTVFFGMGFVQSEFRHTSAARMFVGAALIVVVAAFFLRQIWLFVGDYRTSVAKGRVKAVPTT